MMTCGYFVWSVSVVPLGSLHVPMGRSTWLRLIFCVQKALPGEGKKRRTGKVPVLLSAVFAEPQQVVGGYPVVLTQRD